MNFNRYLLSLLVISFASITNHTMAQDEADAVSYTHLRAHET